MGYEVFEKSTTRVKVPTISVTKNGRISFNSAATRKLREMGIEAVLLLWDKDTSKFAVRKTHKNDIRAHKIRVQREGSIISAKAFLSHIGYDYSETMTLPANWNNKEKIFEVELPRKRLPR